MVLLEGETIFLRPVCREDVHGAYRKWLNDPEVNAYLETRFLLWTPELMEGYVTSMEGNRNEFFFAICLKEERRHIGNIKLGPISWPHRNADVSLIVGEKEFWGKGVATEAIGLVVSFAFMELGLQKLRAGCYAANRASARAFEKNGFIREGLLRAHYWSRGRREDALILGLTRNDYESGGNHS